MTIDEAIEILSMLESRSQNYSTCFKKDAIKLGIEALKYIQRARQHDLYVKPERLPGETEQ